MKKSMLIIFYTFFLNICFGQIYMNNIVPLEVQNGDYGIYLVGYGDDGASYQYTLVTNESGQIYFENNSDDIFNLNEGTGEYGLQDQYKDQEIIISYKITEESPNYEVEDPNFKIKTYTVTRIEVNTKKEKNNTLSPVQTKFYENELTLTKAQVWGDGTYRFTFENENGGTFLSRDLPTELLATTDNDPSEKYVFNTSYLRKKFKLRYVMTSVNVSYSKTPVLEMVIFNLIK